MKKLSLICAFIIIVTHAYSQTIKIDNGISINSMKGETLDLFGDNLVTYSGLVGLEFLQRKWFYLSSEIGYVQLGGKENTGASGQGTPNKQPWDFAHLNTSFRLRARYSKAEFYLGIGPYLNLLLGSTSFDNALYAGYKAQRANWGLKPEAGINEHINRYKIGVNFTYQLPFSSLAKSEYTSLDAKSLSFYLSLGYQLK